MKNNKNVDCDRQEKESDRCVHKIILIALSVFLVGVGILSVSCLLTFAGYAVGLFIIIDCCFIENEKKVKEINY